MKIILTGGHLTPAYAFAQEALNHHDHLSVIGCLDHNSPEYQEFTRLKLEYFKILPVKYDRYRPLISLINLPLILVSLIQSLIILIKVKPQAVVVFGGFLSIPVVLAAKICGINSYLHEQTKTAGLASRFVSRLTQASAISYETSRSHLHSSHIVLTGNLLRPSIWSPPPKLSLDLPTKKPIIFVTGGNQGSAAILDTFKPLISSLSLNYQLIIQSGKLNSYLSDIDSEVLALPWFNPDDISWILHHSNLVICRSGANTVAEIMVAGIPAIMIPLPRSSNDEQLKNALMIADRQAGIILSQSELNPQSLLSAISTIEANYQSYQQPAQNLTKLQYPHAAKDLYQLIASS